jgi:hypothetical protein
MDKFDKDRKVFIVLGYWELTGSFRKGIFSGMEGTQCQLQWLTESKRWETLDTRATVLRNLSGEKNDTRQW